MGVAAPVPKARRICQAASPDTGLQPSRYCQRNPSLGIDPSLNQRRIAFQIFDDIINIHAKSCKAITESGRRHPATCIFRLVRCRLMRSAILFPSRLFIFCVGALKAFRKAGGEPRRGFPRVRWNASSNVLLSVLTETYRPCNGSSIWMVTLSLFRL